MRQKEGVSLIGLRIEMRPVLIAVDALWKQNNQEAVITAGTESVNGTLPEMPFLHSAGSFHTFGFALDFRTRYFTDETKHKIALKLAEILGVNYDVIEEDDHIHVEYNPGFY